MHIIILAIIQIFGLFLVSMYGTANILNMWRVKNYEVSHVFLFAAGMAMMLSGVFLK